MMRTNLRSLLFHGAFATTTIATLVACGGKQSLGVLGDQGGGGLGGGGLNGGGSPWAGGQGGAGGGTPIGVGAGGSAAGGQTGGAGGITISGGRAIERAKQDRPNAIDLLFMIDNSSSMADKQAVFQDAIPQLVKRLINPGCVRTDGTYDSDFNGMSCPPGTMRDFDPVNDIHIGIISSSLGAHGAVGPCDANAAGKFNVDMAHLLTRGATAPPTAGFVAWDATTMTANAVMTTLQSMVAGVTETGCGYEAQLEAVYRFLSDPEPYDTIFVDATNSAVLNGTDQVLLSQRAAFLRPDSLVAVVSLTDEDDCSIRDGGQNWVVLAPPTSGVTLLKRGTVQCAANPNDPCCQSCSQPQRVGCPDINADANCQQGSLTAAQDPQNLRCFDQKRRYGYDFLYPVQRYVDALTGKQVPNRAGQLVENPLFQDLSTACTAQGACKPARDPSLVFYAGIVGVPWQDIAKDPANLANGLLTAPNIPWDKIIGSSAASPPVPPSDPLMVQSVAPRVGLAPPNSGPNANPINGHEWEPQFDQPANADLQYACVFTLPQPRACTLANTSCDCNTAGASTPAARFNPLCQNAQGQYTNTQVRAKAYPGTRHLEVLHGMGDQGVVASACPATVTGDKNVPDYGYNPAVNALVDRMRTKLRGKCLPVSLKEQNGSVNCAVLEGFNPSGNLPCQCQTDPVHFGRITAPASLVSADMKAQFRCICQIAQLSGAQLASCQAGATDLNANGWCYVDPAQAAPGTDITAACAVVQNCADTDKRIIRFMNSAEPQPGSTAFVSCDPTVMSAPPATPLQSCPP